MNHKHHYKKKIFIPFIVLGLFALASAVVMLLWNAILPEVIPGVLALNFWQAAGLLLLSKLLFGGFHKSGYHKKMYPGFREKYMNMSDEQKAKLREEWKRRCCVPEDEPDAAESEKQ